MRIPLVDLSRQAKIYSTEIEKEIGRIVKQADFILGEDVAKFEKEFAHFVKVKEAVGVASGTEAIELSLRALGVGEGDEVIVPAMTFIATVLPIIYLGGKPILVDVLPGIPLMDPTKIEKAITKKTKVIIPVHLHGFVANMEMIGRIADKYKLKILEDACQAHGSALKIKGEWKMAGALGDIAAFSFYPAKNLGGYGDGGMVVTDNKDLAEKIKILRNVGQKEKYRHVELGYNSRLDSIQAAVLSVKLRYLKEWNKKRRVKVLIYNELLKNLPIKLPEESENMRSNYHIYQIRTERRDELLKFLHMKGILCGIHYPEALNRQKALKNLGYGRGNFPNSERFSSETLSLPMFPELTRKEIIYICRMTRKFFQN